MDGPGSTELVMTGKPLQLVAEDQRAVPLPESRLTRMLDGTLKAVLGAALLGELGIVFFNVVIRWVSGSSLVWTLEAAELALSTIAFIGGAFAYRRREHASIRMLVDALPLRMRRICDAGIEYIVLVVALATGLTAIPLFIAQWGEVTPILQIRAGWFVLPLVASMLVLAVTAIERLVGQHRPTACWVGAGFIALALLLGMTHAGWQSWLGSQGALPIALIVFFLPILLGLPVGFALLLGAFAYIVTSGRVPMVALAHTTASGVGNFVLLALPFFIFAGIIMNQGGISLRLVRLVQACVGHFRGGLFQVMVVSMYVVSGLSGSKAADVAAVGSVMRDMLRREGYSLEKSTAVLAASAVMGETVPPSLAMLVLGSVTTLSMGALFVAGFIPAVVVGICLMLLIYVDCRRSRVSQVPRASGRQLVRAALGGLLPLCMPVILLGGIIFGVATPTEVSSFAVIYGLVLAGLVYGELDLKAFMRSVVDCASISGMVLFILGGATSFAWTLTIAQLPHRLVGLLTNAQQSHWTFLVASILLLIVAGSVLEGLPALLILAPLLMPIASQVGVNQLHYGIVLIIAMGIGTFMPPIGVGFYITCAVCETTIEDSARAMIPFLIVLCVGLLVVALVPWFTLYLPIRLQLGG